MNISTHSNNFPYFPHDSKVNSFFDLFEKVTNFMNASQNICSGFTELSTDFSTRDFVDNVHNFVYNFIFSHFRQFSMWITFFRGPVFRLTFQRTSDVFVILYIGRISDAQNQTAGIQHFYISRNSECRMTDQLPLSADKKTGKTSDAKYLPCFFFM